MSTNTSISVVMTTYNGTHYLKEQIDSIIEQLAQEDELVISDDCSTDDTMEMLQGYASRQVRIISTTGQLGPIRNFEFALPHARNDIIALSDQDDRWLPGRLERMRRHFGASSGPYDLLVMNSIITNGALQPTLGPLFTHFNSGPGQIKNVVRNTYVGCHMAFRRALLDVALPFPRAIPMHDMWLGLVSEWVGPVTFDPEPTMLWRRTGENYTKDRYSWRQRIVWRVGLIQALIGRRLSSRFRNAPSRAVERVTH